MKRYHTKIWFTILFTLLVGVFIAGIVSPVSMNAEAKGYKEFTDEDEYDEFDEDENNARQTYTDGDYRYQLMSGGVNIVGSNYNDIGKSQNGKKKADKLVIPKMINGKQVIRISGGFYASEINELVIPDGVESIGSKVFYRSTIKKVTIGSDVVSIGNYAFYSCKCLQQIKGGTGVRRVGELAFGKCKKLKKIPSFWNNKYFGRGFLRGGGLMQNCFAESGVCNLNISVPAATFPTHAYWQEKWFFGCSNLKTVSMKGIKRIPLSTFQNCKNLKKVKLYDGLKEIGKKSFQDCVRLKDIQIPKTVSRIDAYAFENCIGMKKITIPKSVKYIAKTSFKGCKQLTIYCKKGSYAMKYAKKNKIKYKLI